MRSSGFQGLNDSGEYGLARIFDGGALHHSRGQSTTLHAHYAWKLHIGLDAPVWLENNRGSATRVVHERAVLVPPGMEHRTGAEGWSLAVFFTPGRRGLPWRGNAKPLSEGSARRLVSICASQEWLRAEDTQPFASEMARALRLEFEKVEGIDRRVELALDRLKRHPDTRIVELAREVGLSDDRLSKLVVRETGFGLRKHVLWNRLLGSLSFAREEGALARTAVSAGFADHAHMTRTYRRFLGRAPSEIKVPPEILGQW